MGLLTNYRAKAKAKRAERKAFLLVIYNNMLENADPCGFYHNALTSAINRLEGGTDPKRVENWFINLEKLWRQF